ncbi:MAG: NAD(P)H-hydrate dehydratase [Clostridia bacterium]|nr:NAD(P)H-hydrate dehydratase [Clostridia bacterium]
MDIFSYGISDLARIPARPVRSNKGTFGRVLTVGGSVGMSGAAYFAAKAAYRTGAGLVQIMTPEQNRIIYQTSLPEALLALYDPASPDVGAIKNAVCRATCVAVGMGLGTSDTAVTVLRAVLESVTSPLILDADALNILALYPELWALVPPSTVITPHPAEMSRISGLPIDTVCADIPAVAAEFAAQRGLICVLKDARTAVSDGERVMINTSGNSGMATGGSGDVLDGVIAALMAQGCSPFDAAALGVYVHGLAGDRAAALLSEYSVMASDIINEIPNVLKFR